MAFLKEQPGLGVELSIADDFVGVTNSEEDLQRLMNVALVMEVEGQWFCQEVSTGWRSRANGFARKLVEGSWNWGGQVLPRLSKYTYLGGDLSIFRVLIVLQSHLLP